MELAAVIFMVLVVGSFFYFRFEHTNLSISRTTLTFAKLERDYTFVMLSDLHNNSFGCNNEKLLKVVKEAKPDFVVIAGDMIVERSENNEIAFDFLDALAREPFPIYYSLGNHETKLQKNKPEDYESLLRRMKSDGIVVLDNQRESFDSNFCITGLTIPLDCYRKGRRTKDLTGEQLDNLIGSCDCQQWNLLLAHNPVYGEEYSSWGADMTVSGHMHGGIARLPLLGGVISPQLHFFPKYDAGLFSFGERYLYVSRGLGTHTLPLRLWNRPECAVITIKRQE